jgi:hypothetical protein
MDRKTFIAGIGRLQEAYPRNTTLTKSQAQLWYEMLKDIDDESFLRGIVKAIQEGDDWPTIAKIRKACAAASGDGLTPEDRAASLWLTIRRTARSYGGDISIKFDDPACNAAIRSVFGGWVELCEMQSRDIDRLERRFCETYGRLMAAGINSRDAAAMPGRIDKQRSRGGFELEGAKLIETGLPAPSRLRITGNETQLRLGLTIDKAPAIVRQAAAGMMELPDVLKGRAEARKAKAFEDNEATRAEFKERQQAATAALRGRLTPTTNEGEAR